MRVTHLSLSNFRNYESAEVGLAPGVNVIVGENGQGKTNLVEAVAYFSSLSSHRVSSDVALIRAGTESAVARMRIAVAEREALLEIQLNRSQPNRGQINRNLAKPRDLTRWFSSVVFAPEDLSLVRGEPATRRRFLDEALVARHPPLSGVIADYERVVKQRNSLLKSARITGRKDAVEATLSVWDEQLIELGSRIMFGRRALVRELLPHLVSNYRALVGADHSPSLTLSESAASRVQGVNVSRETPATPREFEVANERSVSRETIAAEFAESLASVRQGELDRGVTMVGPHRDDLHLSLNSLPVRGYASHGESWSFALSLRLSLAALLRAESPVGDPVIILDDVFAELDARRRSRLMEAVGDFEQVLVTAAVEEDLPSGVRGRRIHIVSGQVTQITDGRLNEGELSGH
ncbi:DNA replication/repair protein RecF [Leucobacter sp. W1478]|uniref:DNA replication/repair protein RecF n=1 Tax=Leucobacter sp. W1478 TaxID=3439065 RepID=UPI003F2F6318